MQVRHLIVERAPGGGRGEASRPPGPLLSTPHRRIQSIPAFPGGRCQGSSRQNCYPSYLAPVFTLAGCTLHFYRRRHESLSVKVEPAPETLRQNTKSLRPVNAQTTDHACTGGFTSVDQSTWLVTGRRVSCASKEQAPDRENSGTSSAQAAAFEAAIDQNACATGPDRTIVAVSLSPAIAFRDLAAGLGSVVSGTERRRRVVRQLLLRIVRAFHLKLIEQDRRTHDGREGNARAVADQGIASGGGQIAAQSAGIELIEDSASDHLFMSIVGPNPVEHARCKLRTERVHKITIFQSAIAAFFDHLLLELIARSRLRCADEQVSGSRRRRSATCGASMSVGCREIANRLSPNQKIHQRAVVHHGYGSDLYTLVIHFIAPAQALGSELFDGGIVHN